MNKKNIMFFTICFFIISVGLFVFSWFMPGIVAKKEAENLSNYCFNKYINDEMSLFGGQFKRGLQERNACLKEKIIEEIKMFCDGECQKNMLILLDDMESGVLKYYWYLHNYDDFGLIGQFQNDSALGASFEDILKDVIEQNIIAGKRGY